MSVSDELRAIIDSGKSIRKDIAPELGVSLATLSQWATGKEPISEAHLAKLVDSLVDGSESVKESRFLRLLLLLWQERIERRSGSGKEKQRWTESSRVLASRALRLALDLTSTRSRPEKSSGRTLHDFPDSFYPLAIVTGDKREDSETRITAGDFGAVSASHAELRWLCELGLRSDVELYGDKIFVLEGVDELKARFGRKHLLIVGSPGSNHLARRCLLVPPRPGWHPAAAIFRFNLPQFKLQKIEEFLESLAGLRSKQLVG